MASSTLCESEGGERGDLSSCVPLTGTGGIIPATNEAATAGVLYPVLLKVLDKAAVPGDRVIQLQYLIGAVWPSSRYEETWNYKQLSDNSQHEALQVTMLGEYLAGI